jgi:hypothetical protein
MEHLDGAPAVLPSVAVTLDDVQWHPRATAVGALLITDPSLPRDDFGRPYQETSQGDEQALSR